MYLNQREKQITVDDYVQHLIGKVNNVANREHAYTKHWSNHPDSNRVIPVKFIFMTGKQRFHSINDKTDEDEEIDIETVEPSYSSPFENEKSRILARQLERTIKCSGIFSSIDRQNIDELMDTFSREQRNLLNEIMKILNEDILAKNVFINQEHEAIKRNLVTNHSASKLRQIFGVISWRKRLIGWLHKLLLKNADSTIMSSYTEILQVLRQKIPHHVEKLLKTATGMIENERLVLLLKKPFDPVLQTLNQNKLGKVAGNPIVIVCPHAPGSDVFKSSRLSFWHRQMISMCRVVQVTVPAEMGLNLTAHLRKCFDAVLNKIVELKTTQPTKRLFLFGWGAGAKMACYAALQEKVDGIICIGFPLLGCDGSQGDMNDPLLSLDVPTMFVGGNCGATYSVDNMEDFRSRMNAETRLLIAGGCDDLLRMAPERLMSLSVTQDLVDRCLIEEIHAFLGVCMSKEELMQMDEIEAESPPRPPVKQPEIRSPLAMPPIKIKIPSPMASEGKRSRKKRREYSPEIAPTKKRSSKHSYKEKRSRYDSRSEESGGPIKLKIIKKRFNRTPFPQMPKNQVKPAAAIPEQQKEEVIKETEKQPIPDPIPPPETRKEQVPIAKAIRPQKDQPVDVNEAFGCDSSFLPCPFLPDEILQAPESLTEDNIMGDAPESMDISSPDVISGTPIDINLVDHTVQPEQTFVTFPPSKEASSPNDPMVSVLQANNDSSATFLTKPSPFVIPQKKLSMKSDTYAESVEKVNAINALKSLGLEEDSGVNASPDIGVKPAMTTARSAMTMARAAMMPARSAMTLAHSVMTPGRVSVTTARTSVTPARAVGTPTRIAPKQSGFSVCYVNPKGALVTSAELGKMEIQTVAGDSIKSGIKKQTPGKKFVLAPGKSITPAFATPTSLKQVKFDEKSDLKGSLASILPDQTTEGGDTVAKKANPPTYVLTAKGLSQTTNLAKYKTVPYSSSPVTNIEKVLTQDQVKVIQKICGTSPSATSQGKKLIKVLIPSQKGGVTNTKPLYLSTVKSNVAVAVSDKAKIGPGTSSKSFVTFLNSKNTSLKVVPQAGSSANSQSKVVSILRQPSVDGVRAKNIIKVTSDVQQSQEKPASLPDDGGKSHDTI